MASSGKSNKIEENPRFLVLQTKIFEGAALVSLFVGLQMLARWFLEVSVVSLLELSLALQHCLDSLTDGCDLESHSGVTYMRIKDKNTETT